MSYDCKQERTGIRNREITRQTINKDKTEWSKDMSIAKLFKNPKSGYITDKNVYEAKDPLTEDIITLISFNIDDVVLCEDSLKSLSPNLYQALYGDLALSFDELICNIRMGPLILTIYEIGMDNVNIADNLYLHKVKATPLKEGFIFKLMLRSIYTDRLDYDLCFLRREKRISFQLTKNQGIFDFYAGEK